MKEIIYCEPTDRGVHNFYLLCDEKSYYLFSQDYRKGVQEYFARGVSINESMKFSKAHNDSAITRTMSKIPIYVKYIEKEYAIEVYEQTKKTKRKNFCFRDLKCA
jgi:hypothetical protein